VLRLELRACQVEAEKLGLNLQSFVFPRNNIGHLDVLAEAGFLSYRGVTPTPFGWLPGIMEMFRQLGHFIPFAPPVALPERTNGLWNLRSSFFQPLAFQW
jgi:hypothetical protein